MGEVQGIMTDYTQLANEAKAPIPHGECCSCGLCCRTGKINDLADALLACQQERDRLAAERDVLASAIWGEPQPSMTVAETCRQAVDQRVAFDAIDAVKAERDRLRAERDRLVAEMERLRAKLTCPECGQEIHAAHSLECSHDRKDG